MLPSASYWSLLHLLFTKYVPWFTSTRCLFALSFTFFPIIITGSQRRTWRRREVTFGKAHSFTHRCTQWYTTAMLSVLEACRSPHHLLLSLELWSCRAPRTSRTSWPSSESDLQSSRACRLGLGWSSSWSYTVKHTTRKRARECHKYQARFIWSSHALSAILLRLLFESIQLWSFKCHPHFFRL